MPIKKGGASLRLLNTSHSGPLSTQKNILLNYSIKNAFHNAYIKQPLPTSPIGEEFNQFEKSYSFLIINYSLAKLASLQFHIALPPFGNSQLRSPHSTFQILFPLPPPLLSLGYRRTATVGSPSGREPRQSRGLSVEELYFLSALRIFIISHY